jgi:polyhydroxyalkanoate synthase
MSAGAGDGPLVPLGRAVDAVAAVTTDRVAATAAGAANAFDFLFRPDALADTTPLEATVIHRSPQNTLLRYEPLRRTGTRARAPVLLVPPLAAPARCFDLRRGCSVAEHLLRRGHPTYLVDYGPIGFDDRQLGLEHWIDDVLPRAIRKVASDAGANLHVLGWCLGGIMATLAVAARPRLPIDSLTMVASPFDFRHVRIGDPVRLLGTLTGGAFTTVLYRALGGVPAPLTSLAFKASGYQRYLTRPLAVASHLDDREWLGHLHATDRYMNNMLAYPGRSFGQLFHRFFLVNDLVDGRLELRDRTIDLATVRKPVLTIAGRDDALAPRGAVHAVRDLLPRAAEVRVRTAPGGHLGVLTGRGAVLSTWPMFDEFVGGYS